MLSNSIRSKPMTRQAFFFISEVKADLIDRAYVFGIAQERRVALLATKRVLEEITDNDLSKYKQPQRAV